jgi:PAS domain S-box-containing protein
VYAGLQFNLPRQFFDATTYEFLAVNDAAIARYGYSRDEFLRTRITEIRPLEDVPQLLIRLTELEGNESYTTSSRRHRTKAGEVIDVEV